MSSNWPKRIGCHASQIDPLDGNLEGNTPARRPQTVAIRRCDGDQQTDVNREHIMVNSYRSAQLVLREQSTATRVTGDNEKVTHESNWMAAWVNGREHNNFTGIHCCAGF